MSITKPIDTKVRVKPVFIQLIHSAAYEGPCRVGDKEDLTPEVDRQKNKEQFQQFCQEVRREIAPIAEVLEPVVVEWSDDFVVRESELNKLELDASAADLLLMGLGGLPQYPAVAIAERYQKPLLLVGHVATVDVTAYLRTRGHEAYAFLDYEDLNSFLSLFQVRKALAQTRFLVALKGGVIPTGVVSSIGDLEGLKLRYGIDHRLITAEEILEVMRHLTPEQAEEAHALTAQLISEAEQSDMTAAQLLPSVRFYLAARQTLAKYECNAFTLPCFEICATQVMEQEQVTFCLAHSLLKDEGIPSACEGDVNVLTAMAVLMYLSRKAAHMGNTWVCDRENNIIRVHHDVPARKMKGLDAPNVPYGIKNFTVGGWGGTLRYDISRDVGQPVTIARFNPEGTALMATTGEVVGCEGYMKVGCSLAYDLRISDAARFFQLEQDFGHHFALVLGDYRQELRQLSALVGFEVIEA